MVNNKRSVLIIVKGALLLSVVGCASVAVKSDDIEKRTSFALGLERNEFTILDREDNGLRTDYIVKTKSGENYRCYVTGSVTIIGRIVSDAICSNPKGGISSGHTTGSTICNPLLKSAGKC